MKRVLLFVLLLSAGMSSFAQQDYKSRGMNLVAQANYEEAKNQFDAAKTVLITQKVNQNDPAFIDIEKKIAYAQRCIPLARDMNNALRQLNESSVSSAFLQCSSESEADQKRQSLVAVVRNGRSAAQKIVDMFPTDRVSKGNVTKFNELERLIDRNRENFTEVLDWKEVMENQSVASYQAFLSNHPHGIYVQAARDSIQLIQDRAQWAEVMKEPSESALLSYLESFKNGLYRDQAKNRLDALVGKRLDDEAWGDAKRKGTIAAFNSYLSEHPDGLHASDAKATVADLLKREDMAAWEEANRVNTVAAYQQYIQRFPKGIYVSEARMGAQRVDDKKLWDEVCAVNTVESYQRYLADTKVRLFNAEANDRISNLRMKKLQEDEENMWKQARTANTLNAYAAYKSNSSLKSHSAEADGYIALLNARRLCEEGNAPSDAVALFESAAKILTLSDSDRSMYQMAVEHRDFLAFKQQPSIKSGRAYLGKYPNGNHSAQVSDSIAQMLADEMSMNVTEQERDDALSYAMTKSARNYVEDIYRQRTSEKKRYERQLRTEPFHFMLGAGAETQFSSAEVFSSQLQADGGVINTGVRGVLSLGGHSNRVNLELGAGIYTFKPIEATGVDVENLYRFTVSPRWNMIKKRFTGTIVPNGDRPGSEYSLFYMYLSPELSYNLQDSPNFVYSSNLSYGIKLGFGFSFLDFYVGYFHDAPSARPDDIWWRSFFNMGEQFFSVGAVLYLSLK